MACVAGTSVGFGSDFMFPHNAFFFLFCISENCSILALKYLLALILWHSKNDVETKLSSLLQFGATARSTVFFNLSESSMPALALVQNRKIHLPGKGHFHPLKCLGEKRQMFLKG